MAGRYQGPQDNSIVPLQPAAGPTNAFVRPAQPEQILGENEATQLGKALSEIQPSLTNFLYHTQAREDESAANRAKILQNQKQTALNYKDAVKAGIIPLDKNPFFEKAWNEQSGSVAADHYMTDQMVALAAGPLAATRDPEESNKLLTQFRQSWIQQNGITQQNPVFQEAFNRKANQYDTTAQEHQAAQIGQRRIGDTINNTYQLARATYQDALTKNLPPSAVGDSLSQIANTLALTGMPWKQINGILTDATEAEALDRMDTKPYDALKYVSTGGGTLADTKEVVQSKLQLTNEIAAKQHQADQWAYTLKVRQREEHIQDVTADIYKVIGQNRENGVPTTENMFEKQITELGQYSVGAAEQLREVVKKALEPAPRYDDPDTINALWYKGINETLSVRDINGAFSVGKIRHESATALAEWLKATQREHREKVFTTLPGVQHMFSDINKAFGADEFHLPDLDKIPSLNKATHEAFDQMAAWTKAHPDADPAEVEKKGYEIYESVVRINGTNPMNPNKAPDPVEQARQHAQKNVENIYNQMGPSPGATAGLSQPFYAGANGRNEWIAELNEWATTGARTDNPTPGLNTKLGKRLASAGITDPHEINDFIVGQSSLYPKPNQQQQ
jgi:hypothetical protein